jgi:hypothetical protein
MAHVLNVDISKIILPLHCPHMYTLEFCVMAADMWL